MIPAELDSLVDGFSLQNVGRQLRYRFLLVVGFEDALVLGGLDGLQLLAEVVDEGFEVVGALVVFPEFLVGAGLVLEDG